MAPDTCLQTYLGTLAVALLSTHLQVIQSLYLPALVLNPLPLSPSSNADLSEVMSGSFGQVHCYPSTAMKVYIGSSSHRFHLECYNWVTLL